MVNKAMTLHTQRPFGGTRTALVGLTMLLLGQSPGSAQTLTPSANPSSGAPGVNSSYVTGSGFPAGAITNATLAFGAACAAPALTTTAATRVTSIGSLRRFQFLIPASLAPGSYKVWVSGNAGATPFTSVGTPSCSTITVTGSVQGTASLGAAIGGGIVTLVDATGTVRNGVTASDGTYKLDTTGLVPPYLVKVITTADSGGFPAGTALYSVSADGGVSSRINVTVLSDPIMRSYYSALGTDPNAAFANPVGDPAPTPVAVASIASLLLPAVQKWLDDAGVNATGGTPGNGQTNVISSPLVAYQPGAQPFGLDAMLHQIAGETLNPDGSVAAITIAEGTVSEEIAPSYAGGLVTFTFATTDSVTGKGSAGSLSGLALDPVTSAVLDEANLRLTALKDTINVKGVALAASDLLPFYSADYLSDGKTAAADADEFVSEVAGVTVVTLEAVGITSVFNDIATIILDVEFRFGNDTFSGVDTQIFRNEAGVWRLYGNQYIAEVRADVEARTHQGQGGFSAGTFAFASASAVQGVLTGATVSGPTNIPAAAIWSGASSKALFQGAQRIEGGVTYDQFFLLSQPLGATLNAVSTLVPVGSTFNMDLTTTSQGSRQYAVQSGAITTENIRFLGLPAHMTLAALVNKTVPFQFTLPKTLAFSNVEVHLFAEIFNAVQGQTPKSCGIGGDILTVDNVNAKATGTVTFPADMSACGLAPGVPITFINVFGEVDGKLGESTLAFVSFPY